MNDQDQIDIDASRQGDHEAYRRLVQRYQGQVSALMWRFCRDRNVCEELVQEVFVEVYFSLDNYRQRAPFVHWLKKIATRVGYRLWKHQARAKGCVQLEDAAEIEAPEDRRDLAAVNRVVSQLLDRLAPVDRLVLTLLYFDDCSTDQIAQRMGWNRAMVKMRAYRARMRLRAIAEQEGILEDLEWTP